MEQQISLTDAQALVARLQANPVTGLAASETFGLEIVNAVIGTEGCASLRIYYGKKEDGSICAILVPVDSDGNDLDGTLGEDGFRCPPFCPPKSLLIP